MLGEPPLWNAWNTRSQWPNLKNDRFPPGGLGLHRRLANRFMSALGSVALCLLISAPAQAQQSRIGNDLGRCSANSGPGVMVTVSGIRSAEGTLRVQSYRGSASDWLQKGRWINRIEAPAQEGSMAFCVPLPGAGTYAIAVRHDVNGNGATDVWRDGGGISNNPAINIFNLGKPSHKKAAFSVGTGITPIRVEMRYR